MMPVMAEAFINLVLYILMKPEIKKDERLRENVIRQPIDIRVKSLFHNCIGFKHPVDYANEVCRRYHTLVNDRNDLLHGNVVIDKLRFNELYFNGTVPVFIEYSSMWDRSLGVARQSVGLDSIHDELEVVDNFVQYVTSCSEDEVRGKIQLTSEKFDLGLNKETGRVGVLFPDWLADFVVGPSR